MGGSQSKMQKFNRKGPAVASRRTFKSWSLGIRKQKKQRHHSRGELASPVMEDSPPWVGGHKVFVVLEDGQGLFVNRDST